MAAITIEPIEAAVRLRPIDDSDREFLYQVYASTRLEELAAVQWTEAEREHFLRGQFAAQDRSYRENYPGAELQIVVFNGVPVGRHYVHRRESEIRIMDLALLPECRGQGIGTLLLTELLREGAASDRPVTIHVEIFNPARRLYERLGFSKIATQGVYDLMEWRPESRLIDLPPNTYSKNP